MFGQPFHGWLFLTARSCSFSGTYCQSNFHECLASCFKSVRNVPARVLFWVALIKNFHWLHKHGVCFFFVCDVELNIHKADFWDRQDKTCSSYIQMPLKLETVFFSKVSSSLVTENIFKCWFKQFDSGSKGRLHFRITQGNRGNEPCKFFVKQFSTLFKSILRFNICMKALT